MSEEAVYCTVHTNVETSLRCNRCSRPMCPRCAVKTPVGYRCKECVRGQQEVFFNSQALDPIIQGGVSFVLSAIAAALVSLIGGGLGIWLLWLITIPASSAAGALIADLSHRAVGRRRGRYSWLAVGGGIVMGALAVATVPALLSLLMFGSQIAAYYDSNEYYDPEVAYDPEAEYDPEVDYYPETGDSPGMWLAFGLLGFTNIGWWVYVVVATIAAVGTLRVGRGGRFRFRR